MGKNSIFFFSVCSLSLFVLILVVVVTVSIWFSFQFIRHFKKIDNKIKEIGDLKKIEEEKTNQKINWKCKSTVKRARFHFCANNAVGKELKDAHTHTFVHKKPLNIFLIELIPLRETLHRWCQYEVNFFVPSHLMYVHRSKNGFSCGIELI